MRSSKIVGYEEELQKKHPQLQSLLATSSRFVEKIGSR